MIKKSKNLVRKHFWMYGKGNTKKFKLKTGGTIKFKKNKSKLKTGGTIKFKKNKYIKSLYSCNKCKID